MSVIADHFFLAGSWDDFGQPPDASSPFQSQTAGTSPPETGSRAGDRSTISIDAVAKDSHVQERAEFEAEAAFEPDVEVHEGTATKSEHSRLSAASIAPEALRVLSTASLTDYLHYLPDPEIDPAATAALHPLDRLYPPRLLDYTTSEKITDTTGFPDHVPMFVYPNDVSFKLTFDDADAPVSTWHSFTMTDGASEQTHGLCVHIWMPLDDDRLRLLESACAAWREEHLSLEEKETVDVNLEKYRVAKAKLKVLELRHAAQQGNKRVSIVESDELEALRDTIAIYNAMLLGSKSALSFTPADMKLNGFKVWMPRTIGLIGHDRSQFGVWRQWLSILGARYERDPSLAMPENLSSLRQEIRRLLSADRDEAEQVKVSLDGVTTTSLCEANYELFGTKTVDLYPLLRCITLAKIVSIVEHLLCEQRCILRSRHASLLGNAAHALISLLWPLQWQGIFVPVLPRRLLAYLEAPAGYMMGVLSSYYTDPNPGVAPPEPLPSGDDVIVVDLDVGEVLSTTEPPPLPQRIRSKLLSLLELAAPVSQPSASGLPRGPPIYTRVTYPYGFAIGTQASNATSNLQSLNNDSSATAFSAPPTPSRKWAPKLNMFGQFPDRRAPMRVKHTGDDEQHVVFRPGTATSMTREGHDFRVLSSSRVFRCDLTGGTISPHEAFYHCGVCRLNVTFRHFDKIALPCRPACMDAEKIRAAFVRSLADYLCDYRAAMAPVMRTLEDGNIEALKHFRFDKDVFIRLTTAVHAPPMLRTLQDTFRPQSRRLNKFSSLMNRSASSKQLANAVPQGSQLSLNADSPAPAPLLSRLVETQAFANFIADRCAHPDPASFVFPDTTTEADKLALFDHICTARQARRSAFMHSLRTSSVHRPNSRLSTGSSTGSTRITDHSSGHSLGGRKTSYAPSERSAPLPDITEGAATSSEAHPQASSPPAPPLIVPNSRGRHWRKSSFSPTLLMQGMAAAAGTSSAAGPRSPPPMPLPTPPPIMAVSRNHSPNKAPSAASSGDAGQSRGASYPPLPTPQSEVDTYNPAAASATPVGEDIPADSTHVDDTRAASQRGRAPWTSASTTGVGKGKMTGTNSGRLKLKSSAGKLNKDSAGETTTASSSGMGASAVSGIGSEAACLMVATVQQRQTAADAFWRAAAATAAARRLALARTETIKASITPENFVGTDILQKGNMHSWMARRHGLI